MDEPTHSNESRFWEHVSDWIRGVDEPGHSALSESEIREWRRENGIGRWRDERSDADD
jgi:hypothetical protein